MRNQFRDMGREVVGAIEDGRIGEMIADRLKSRLLDMALDGLFDFMGGGKSDGGGFLNTAFRAVSSAFGGGRAGGGGIESGYRYDMAEHGPELALFGTRGQVMNHAETAQMVRDLAGVGGGSTSAIDGGGIHVSATYAPNIRVSGSGPEIDALRRELAAERAGFKSNVIQAVNDGMSRRQIG